MKKGILLINLGSPTSPDPKDVGRYLGEFLTDPFVIDIPYIFRQILVQCIIRPTRSKTSSEAYKKIWQKEGSPLVFHTKNLAKKVGKCLGNDYIVQYAMRYQFPSIDDRLTEMLSHEIKDITIFPLYPQYAESTTRSTFDKVDKVLKKSKSRIPVKRVGPFYDDEGFLNAFYNKGKDVVKKQKFDHILFSFHGLPERHLTKLDLGKDQCLKKDDCCNVIKEANKNCYKAHCVQTAKSLANKFRLKEDDFSISFQSRLGRTPWIRPYTDEVIIRLAEKGKKRIIIFVPSFVADCLETLEEIEIRAKKDFIEKGGEELFLVPSLNSDQDWVQAVARLILKASYD